jgi:hypothetical protein
MRILKAPKRWYCIKTKGRSRDLAELGTSARGAIIGKTDKALVEGSVPEGGKAARPTTEVVELA